MNKKPDKTYVGEWVIEYEEHYEWDEEKDNWNWYEYYGYYELTYKRFVPHVRHLHRTCVAWELSPSDFWYESVLKQISAIQLIIRIRHWEMCHKYTALYSFRILPLDLIKYICKF